MPSSSRRSLVPGGAALVLLASACAPGTSPAVPCAPSSAAGPTSSSADVAAVRALSDAWFAAYKAGDAGWFERNLADDFAEYSSHGATISKAQTIADVRRHALTFDVLEPLAEGRTFRASGDLAVETGTERVLVHAAEGKGAERAYHYTTVFVRRDGRWLGLVDHITEIASGVAATPSPPSGS